MAGGRPTTYNQELAEKVLKELESPRAIKDICDSMDWMPTQSTLYCWQDRHPSFSEGFKKARATSYYKELDHATDSLNEKLRFYTDDKGNNRIDSPSATLAMAALNTKKWLLQKFAPQQFGDKPQQDNAAESFIAQALKDKLNQSDK
jgi:hypothetical protein